MTSTIQPFDTLDLAIESGRFNSFHAMRCYNALKTLWQRSEVREEILAGQDVIHNDHICLYGDPERQTYSFESDC